jgi:hypothetical protein
MSLVQSVTASSNYYQQSSVSSGVTVAAAFSAIRINPRAKFDIQDTAANIEKNLDELKKVVNNVKSINLDGAQSGVVNLTSKQLMTPGVLTLLNKKNLSGADNGISLNVSDVLAKDVASINSNAKYEKISQFSVKDSAANIALKLSNLQASGAHLSQVWLTDTAAPVKVTYAQYTDSSDVLAKLRGTYGLDVSAATTVQALSIAGDEHLNSVSILDHSQAIADNLDALQTDLGVKVKALASDDNAILKINANQLQKDKAVIGKLYKGYQLAVFNVDSMSVNSLKSNKKIVTMDIVDTAENLSRNLVLLDRLGSQIQSVRVTDTDPSANPLTMTANDFLSNGNVLSKVIQTVYTDGVADQEQSTTPTADNNIYKLNIVNASAVDAQVLKSNEHIQSISVTDTSAAISINLGDLSDNTKVTAISQMGTVSVLNITAEQLTEDQNALSLLGSENYMLNVRGVQAQDALSLLDNAHIASMSVSDSAANLLTHLEDLAKLGKSLSSITQTDSGQSLQLTAGQWATHMGVLSKIVGGYGVNLTEVSATQALDLASDLRVRSLTVSDSGAAISANLDALMGMGTKLSSISQSDATAIQISGKQFTAYASSALGKLGADYTLAVSSAKANQIQTMAGNAHVRDIKVLDTQLNISANLSALKTALVPDTAPQIQVDILGMPSAFTLTKTQIDDYSTALDKINANYTIRALDVALSDVSQVSANSHVISMDVKAAALDLSDPDKLSSLRSLGAKLNRIVQTDAGTALSMSASDWASNSGVLEKVKGYTVALTQTSVASGLNLLTKPHVKSISVSDTATQISGSFDKLMALGSSLQGITQSGTDHLKLSMKQWISAAAAPTLAKVNGDYMVDIIGASATQAQSLVQNNQIGLISVTDSAANLSARLDVLTANNKISTVQLSDPATPVNMTMQQFSDDAVLLNKFQGGYGFTVTQATTADLGQVFANRRVVSAEIEGTASQIQTTATMNVLNQNSTRVKSLKLTDENPSLTLAYSDFQKDKAVLSLIKTPFAVVLNQISANAALIEGQNTQFNISGLNVKDTAAQVAANLSGLGNLGSKLTGLATNENAPVLTVSAAQYVAQQSTLAKINKVGANEGVYTLTVKGADMTLATNMVSNAHVQNISVIDNANTVGNQINLLSSAKIASVKLTADGSEISITGAQYANNLGSFSKIVSPFSLNVTAAQPQLAATLQADDNVGRFALTSASNVGLDVASSIGVEFPAVVAMSKLDRIDFTQANARVALTVAQLYDVQANQAKLHGDYVFDVSGVSMADLSDFLAESPSRVGSVQVSDTSQAIATGWDDLLALSSDGLAGLTVTTPQTPVAITLEQYNQSSTVLAKLTSQPLALLDVAPGQATDVAAFANVSTVSVKGSAAEVAAEFDNLVTLADKLDDIQITDDGPLMLTQDQVDNAQTTLDKINGGHFNVQVLT